MAGTLTVQNIEGPSSGANANKVILNTGQTLYAPGHVVQTIFVNDSDEYANNTTSYTDTNLTATITPTSSNSKILVTSNLALDVACGTVLNARLLRGSTAIKTEGYWAFISTQSTADYILMRQPHIYLDSPATTSAITYKWQIARHSGTALAAYLSYDDTSGVTDSQFVLQEIAQ
tara:strand:+ start:56 stop:580 length:525 start_codon:yes stop_codon:yes gene_type:complete